MTCSVFVGTSLDGFIAREDGGIDWLTAAGDPQDPAAPEDFGYQAFFATVDALVMGRNTFDLVRTFDRWPYGDTPVFVLTTRPVDDRATGAGTAATTDTGAGVPPTVEVMSGAPRDVVRTLEARGFRHLYVDGGRVIQAFLADGLIDRMTISVLPILIGRGIPLFGPTPRDIHLRHVATRTFPGGMVQMEYEVVRG